ncbi:hypothetical protein KJ966_14595 [bacterium]|nr:hypothetical protein [bacterium]
MAEQANTEPPKAASSKSSSGFVIDPELLKRINESLALPIPGREEFWKIDKVITNTNDKKFLGLFKRKSLSQDEVNDLRKSAIQSPGNTRTRINKLKKQYPNSPVLYMLSAICTNGMLLNSSNQKEVFRGLKTSTKEAAMALVSNGVNIYNCENFFRIYFTMVDRFKRYQVRVYESVASDPRLDKYKQKLIVAMRVIDQMSSDKSRVFNVLNHMKKKLKSSLYAATFSFNMIRDAAKYMELGKPKEKMGLGTASEVIAYVYALGVAFARIPSLSILVDEILELLPDSQKPLLIRKISIRSVRNFAKFKIATLEGERDTMAALGKQIFKDNLTGVQKLEGQSLYQSYETDPFFNLAFIAELSVGLYKPDDFSKIVDTAITAVESVIKRDMSKNHIFTEAANNHTHKLNLLKEGKPGKD